MSQACIYDGVGGKTQFLIEAERQARAARLREQAGLGQSGLSQSPVQILRQVVRQLGHLNGRFSRIAPGT